MYGNNNFQSNNNKNNQKYFKVLFQKTKYFSVYRSKIIMNKIINQV